MQYLLKLLQDHRAERLCPAKEGGVSGLSIEELEELGSDAVREKLVQGVWNDRKVATAERWLAEIDRRASIQASKDSAKSAASSRLAAWVAAVSAVVAAAATIYGAWPI
ncbi:hypothetical protein [Leisingera caerulea]|uniref:hypothetical protein n=1 Tax=Leisingera caerulea TaxID=506591 RepID=UPI000480AA57|nr:hypothetical protein [Leisingera caerulea]